jgi:hypothetical protein
MLIKENSIRKEKNIYNIEKNKFNYIFIFKCKNCDEEIRVQSSSFKTHSGKCRSCSQQGEDYAHIYNELKNHRNLKVEFKLTFEEFLNIIKTPICEYCKTEIVYNKHSKNWGKGLSRAHQLDRKDNLKGYIKDNVVCCCWTCNRLKSDVFTYEEFNLLSPTLQIIMKNRKEDCGPLGCEIK